MQPRPLVRQSLVCARAMCHKIGTIVKQKAGKLTVLRLRCKSWGCPDCAKIRRRKLVAEAMEGKPTRFITLTVNPNWFDSPEDRAARLVKAWRLIRRRYLALRPSHVLEFFAVFELTKKGEPHLHIVARGTFIPQKWLSAQMAKEMGAPVVDVRAVKGSKEVAKYVSKYISKRNIKIGSLKRYWRSIKYLEKSNAAKRRERNAGARFFILDCHYWSYVKTLQDRALRLTAIGDEFSTCLWPDANGPPPWCLTVVPMGQG